MKKWVLGLCACWWAMTVSAATTYNDSLDDLDPGVSTDGTVDIVGVEVSHTDTDLVFDLTVEGNLSLSDWGKFMIGFATAGNPGTTGMNAWGRPIYLDSPLGGMNYWVGAWVDGGGGAELHIFYEGHWSSLGALATYSFTPGTQSLVSITVPRADVGLTNHAGFYFDVYSSGGLNNDSAYDALSNPSVSITSASSPYTSRTNDTGLSYYSFAVAADVFPANGPFAGGNRVLATNAVAAIGNGSDITNVLVGGVAGTILGQGTNWVEFVAPATGSAGAKAVVIQSTSAGDTTLAGAYTVNAAGSIGSTTPAEPLPPLVTLTNTWLDGTNGVIFAGAAPTNRVGYSVSSAGDVNGDGYADLLIGGSDARGFAGDVYLVFGTSDGIPTPILLTNTWLNGTNGVTFAGAKAYDYCGISVSSAGDVNGDGLADLLIGAYGAYPSGRSNAGETYLVYGRTNSFPSTVIMTNTWLDGTNGVIFAGAKNSDMSGVSVRIAGDVNGDGLADLLIGAFWADPSGRNNAGEAYLVFGRSNDFPAMVTLTNTWLDGTNGVTFAGRLASDYCGTAVSSAGDVNGDGLADLLIGAFQADPSGRSNAGETYLIFGRTNSFPATVMMTNSWLSGVNGVTFAGAVAGGYSGRAVSSAGDVNGDGLADLLIGAYLADPSGRDDAGETYLVYGRTNSFPTTVTLTNTWLDGVNGVTFAGAVTKDYCGMSVSSAGDMNGDGFGDVLIGAYGVRSEAGETYLVHGRSNGFPSVVTLTNSWLDGTNGVLFAGAGVTNKSGYSVSGAGDMNGDGAPDLLIGAYGVRSETGETYLVYGKAGNISGGVTPESGSWTGGYPVVITGTNLGNGADITNVTLCGASATIESQSATQIVVTAGVAISGGLGDVRVYSASYGETVKSNAFTYNAPGLQVLGTNRAVVASGDAAQAANGTKFAPLLSGASWTNTYAITNNGTETVSISGVGISDVRFEITGMPASVAAGTASNFTVRFAPNAAGSFAGVLTISNTSPTAAYVVNLAGSCYSASTNVGPYAGGNWVTFTNGNFGTITNVLVGGVAATIVDSGASWFTIAMPALGAEGVVDVVVQTSDNGETVLGGAYTYHPRGQIGGGEPWDWSAWETVEAMPGKYGYAGAAAFSNKLFSVGGQKDLAVTNDVVSYDGAHWSFEMPFPTNIYSSGVAVYNGYLYSVAGRHTTTAITNVFRFDGVSWTEVAGQPAARRDCLAAVIGNYLYSIGGSDAGGNASTNVYRYDGTTWTQVPGLPETASRLRGGMLNGLFYIVGGHNARTNVYSYDGTNFVAVAALPDARQLPGASVLNGALYVYGGYAPGTVATNSTFLFDGTNWSQAAFMPQPKVAHAGATYQGRIYAMAGSTTGGRVSNVFCYPAGMDTNGVSPSSGSWTGNYSVLITGTNLGNGADITNVTLCGMRATITNQTAQRVWVRVGQAVSPGVGDVVVQSTSFGTTVKSNGFTYNAPGLRVLGTNGAVVASGDAAQVANGTKFAPLLSGASWTNTFAITNNGTEALALSGFGISDVRFEITGMPASVAAGTASNFTVRFAPNAAGSFAGVLTISNNSPTAAYIVNLAGSCYAATTNAGPFGGGNVVTFTNGNFGTITNVLVGGVAATILDSGASWFTITLPAASASGQVDIVVQTSDNGETTLANAYTYHAAGSIGGLGIVYVNLESSPIEDDYIYMGDLLGTGFISLVPSGSDMLLLYDTHGIQAFLKNNWTQTLLPQVVWTGTTVSNLPVGTVIDSSMNWLDIDAPNMFGFPLNEYGYVGFRFQFDSQSDWRYGWVRAKRKSSGLGHAVSGMAFTSEDGMTIAAGQTQSGGVVPESGSWTGGYEVVISGTNLCNGADATNVTLCGVETSIQSQSSTQIVVLAGAAVSPGVGDVRVFSTSYGETVKSNAFTYLAPGLRVLGTNGAVVVSDSDAQVANGTKFPPLLSGASWTNTFAITNNGTETVVIWRFRVCKGIIH